LNYQQVKFKPIYMFNNSSQRVHALNIWLLLQSNLRHDALPVSDDSLMLLVYFHALELIAFKKLSTFVFNSTILTFSNETKTSKSLHELKYSSANLLSRPFLMFSKSNRQI
jgi:hypothetical protein